MPVRGFDLAIGGILPARHEEPHNLPRRPRGIQPIGKKRYHQEPRADLLADRDELVAGYIEIIERTGDVEITVASNRLTK